LNKIIIQLKFNNKNKLQLTFAIKLRIKPLNKFAPIIFVLLLSCGAALWFLASDSLNFHIKNQLEIIGSDLSQQNLSVESVNIRSYQGSGTILNLHITPKHLADHSKTAKPTLSIDSIDFTFDRKSLKEDIIIIDSITLHGLNVLFSNNKEGTTFETLQRTVQRNIHNFTALQNNMGSEQQDNKNLRLLKVSKVVVKPGTLRLISDKNQQIITNTLHEVELSNIGNEAGSKGEVIGIEVFEQLLKEINNQIRMAHNNKTASTATNIL